MKMRMTKEEREAVKQSRLPIGFTVQGVVAKAGGVPVLARDLGVPSQSIHKWTKIPNRHAHRVAVLAGLPLAVVRPDMVR
jgi:hypothetical protein